MFGYLMELPAINESVNDKYSLGFNLRLNYQAVGNLSRSRGGGALGDLV